MMRLFLLLIACAAFWVNGALAQTNEAAEAEFLCPVGNNLAELEMQILESDLTLEAALSATDGLKRWLPELSKAYNSEAAMAISNMLSIIKGYQLRELVLSEPDPVHRELALTRFCNFMSKAIYID